MLRRLREDRSLQGLVLILPTLVFMVGLLIIPLMLTLVVSFGRRAPDGSVIYTFTLDNYLRLLGYERNCPSGAEVCFNPLYLQILWRSISLAFNTTVLVILLAYPLAYYVARAPARWRTSLLFLVLVPMWTNFVIRVYAWMMLLRKEGVINLVLGWLANLLGISFQPLEMLYTPGAVLVGMVYEFLPFMILPIYTSLEKIDLSMYEAAADLGANPWRTFLRVTLAAFPPRHGGRDDPGLCAGDGHVRGFGSARRSAGGAGRQPDPASIPGCARCRFRIGGFAGADGVDADRDLLLHAQIRLR